MPLLISRAVGSALSFGLTGASVGPPCAPTGVSASATSCSAISVSFTAPVKTGGKPITLYQVVCTSTGTKNATGSSSPISITGLSPSTSYTFYVRAQNSIGYGPYSSTVSVTTNQARGSVTYCGSCFTWVAPAGVTSVSIVVVGKGAPTPSGQGSGGGGGLSYKNNISVTPGSSYNGFISYQAQMFGATGGQGFANGGSGGGHSGGCGGGNGGPGWTIWNGNGGSGGGGAGGYSGNGGYGGQSPYGAPGADGAGGGGGGGYYGSNGDCCGFGAYSGSNGGGVGIWGQGANGSGGGGNGSMCTGSPGAYGGGGGGQAAHSTSPGVVRIVWPGNSRQFPTTDVRSP